MFNPIEEKRRLVQERIAKSFDSGINLSEEMSLEKAKYQVGQPHPNNPNILWTEWQPGKFDWKSKNGRYWKGKTGGGDDKKSRANATDNEFKNVEFHHGQYYFNTGVDKHNYVILKKLSDKQVAKYKEYQEKRNKDALDATIRQAINDWKNTTNTSEKERAWKNIIDKILVKRAHGYTLTNEEDYYWKTEQMGKKVDSKSDKGKTTIHISPGQEDVMYEEAARVHQKRLASAPEELKDRNYNIENKLEKIGESFNKKHKKDNPKSYFKPFDYIETGGMFGSAVPEDNNFEFKIYTNFYVTKDANKFVNSMMPEIEKLANKNGFNYICVDDAYGDGGKKVKVEFKKELSTIEKKMGNFRKLSVKKF